MIGENGELPGNNEPLPAKAKQTRNRKPAKAEPVAAADSGSTTIILEENDNIPPGLGQFIGVNGRTWHLHPGRPAKVPQGVIDALDNAVEKRPVVDPDTNKVVDYTERLRFPYRIVRDKAA